MVRLARQVGWPQSVAGKTGRKQQLRAVGIACLGNEVKRAAVSGSTAQRWVSRWPVRGYDGAMADYLARRCPLGWREGRRFKTRLRSGAWRQWLSEGRDVCPCCGALENTAEHAVFGCEAVAAEARAAFLDAMEVAQPGFCV